MIHMPLDQINEGEQAAEKQGDVINVLVHHLEAGERRTGVHIEVEEVLIVIGKILEIGLATVDLICKICHGRKGV